MASVYIREPSMNYTCKRHIYTTTFQSYSLCTEIIALISTYFVTVRRNSLSSRCFVILWYICGKGKHDEFLNKPAHTRTYMLTSVFYFLCYGFGGRDVTQIICAVLAPDSWNYYSEEEGQKPNMCTRFHNLCYTAELCKKGLSPYAKFPCQKITDTGISLPLIQWSHLY